MGLTAKQTLLAQPFSSLQRSTLDTRTALNTADRGPDWNEARERILPVMR